MPQQLIYTSSPRGLVAGRSGYCAVACTEGMREGLQSRLEQISYFEHATQAGARHSRVFAFRVLEIRGTRFHCLTRIVDAGLDFTKRTNFTAHHLVFSSTETASLPPPPLIFLHWNGWRDNWSADPQWLRDESWGNLFSLPVQALIPCANWQRLTGDAANAASLLETRETFLADGFDSKITLMLIAESLALQTARPGGGNAWDVSFTALLQESDDPADFRCRLAYSGTPAHARLLARGGTLIPLRDARSKKLDEGTATCARSGLVILEQPKEDQTAHQHDILSLNVKASLGVPVTYQWYICSKEGKPQEKIPNATGPLLNYELPRVEAARYFCVVVTTIAGSVQSQVAKVTTLPPSKRDAESPSRVRLATPNPALPAERATVKPKVWTDIPITTDEDDATFIKDKSRNRFPLIAGILFSSLVLLVLFGHLLYKEITKANESTERSNGAAVDTVSATNKDAPEEAILPAGQGAIPTNRLVNTRTQGEDYAPQYPSRIALIWSPPAQDANSLAQLNRRLETVISDEKNQNEKVVIARQEIAGLTTQLQEESQQLQNTDRKNTEEFQKKQKTVAETQQKMAGKEQTIQQATDKILEDQNEAAALQSQLNITKNMAATCNQLNESTLSHMFENVFATLPDGKVYWKAIDLLDTNKTDQGDCSSDSVVQIAKEGDFECKIGAITNHVFSVKRFNPIKITGPVCITFSTNAEFRESPTAKLLIWPGELPFPATYNDHGRIAFYINQNVIDAINSLQPGGGYEIQLTVSYGDGSGTNYFINYQKIAAVIDYSDLPEKINELKMEWVVVTNLLNIESLAKHYGTLTQSSNIWDEVGKIGELFVNGRIGLENGGYDFEHDLNGEEAKRLRRDIEDNTKLTESEKDRLTAAFGPEQLHSLDMLIKGGHLGAIGTLSAARSRLEYYDAASGVPKQNLLRAFIQIKMSRQDQYPPLVQFVFKNNSDIKKPAI